MQKQARSLTAPKGTGSSTIRRLTGWRVLALLAAGLLALAGCQALPPLTASPAAPASKGPLDLTIVHSNDTWGYLRPCG